jgi:hypothetical protein
VAEGAEEPLRNALAAMAKLAVIRATRSTRERVMGVLLEV